MRRFITMPTGRVTVFHARASFLLAFWKNNPHYFSHSRITGVAARTFVPRSRRRAFFAFILRGLPDFQTSFLFIFSKF